MAALIFVGWIVGLIAGVLVVLLPFIALGLGVPALLAPLSPILASIAALLTSWVAVALSAFLLVGFTAAGYASATLATAPLLPALTLRPALSFPRRYTQTLPPGAAVLVPPTAGEFFGRGLMIGLSAAVNALVLTLVPIVGPLLAAWAFTVISLGMIIFVARNVVYQGALGWSAWLLPLSHVATVVGLLLFSVNLLSALSMFGLGAVRIDWSTGVIETSGGTAVLLFLRTPPPNSGFSLGNFTFLAGLPAAGDFLAPSLSSHETGHSLNTALFGGIVLWINAIDENVVPIRKNLAYGELIAESHANNLGTDRAEYSLRLWS